MTTECITIANEFSYGYNNPIVCKEKIMMEFTTYVGIILNCFICMIVMDELSEMKIPKKRYFEKSVLLIGTDFLLWFMVTGRGELWNILAMLLEVMGYCIYLAILKSKQSKFLKIFAIAMIAQITKVIIALLSAIFVTGIEMILNNTKYQSQLLLLAYVMELVLLYICHRAQYVITFVGVLFYFSKLVISVFHNNVNSVFLYIAITVLIMGIFLGTLWLINWYYDEKEKKLLWEDNRQMSQRIHRSKEILPALSSALDNLKTDHDTEEVYHILGEIHQLCEEQMEDYKVLDSQSKIFPATGIYLLDEQIQVYNTEAGKKGIHFDVFVGEPLSDVLKQRKIKELDFLRLIGDLMRNAFRAIEKKKDGTGNILLVMGVIGDVLQIDIYDDGVAFPLFILDEFGKRGNTEGGTGNGVTDMLELLEKHKATYQLTEYEKEDTFTKGISIIWDGKNERWIDSYRSSEISPKSILLPKEF